jgi:hypothetical protein
MKKNKVSRRKILATVIVLFAVGFVAKQIYAYSIQNLIDAPVVGDFTISPGEETTKIINITSRLGETTKFKIEIEDFIGSSDGGEAAILLGSERGPYSLRDYIRPEISEFTLEHGQRMDLPIKVSIPQDATPGGLYGAVIIRTIPAEEGAEINETDASGKIQFVGRVASLFFVRVKGDVLEEGQLEKFGTINNKKIYPNSSVPFVATYKNKGSVHLVPYGILEIKNMLSKKIDEVEIKPYFVMPNATRSKEINWQRASAMGYYKAHLYLNRGYGNVVDEAEIGFWVIPWKIVTIAILVSIAITLSIVWLTKNVEFKKKRK